MAADDKVIERIAKLLRLAAPSSGTTLPERTTAALEAAKLIDEHGVAIQPTKQRSKVSIGAWVLTQALDRVGCAACGHIVSPGDVVWFRSINHRREYRHNAGACSVV